MNNYVLGFFDFSPEKFSSPIVIIGLVLLVLSVIFIAASSKIDEAIRRKRASKEIVIIEDKDKDIDVFDEKTSNGDASQDTSIDEPFVEDVNSNDGDVKVDEPLTDEDRQAIKDEIVKDLHADDEETLFRRSDGSFNYFTLFKIIGLVLVFVSAIMVVFGMN